MKIPEGWPTEEMLFAAREACDDMFQGDFIRAFKAALAAAPTPPEQEVKPVVWIDPDNLDCVLRQGRGGALRYVMPEPEQSTDIPLYTHPAATKLRKAAEEVYEEFQRKIAHGDNGAQLLDALENLRAALEGK